MQMISSSWQNQKGNYSELWEISNAKQGGLGIKEEKTKYMIKGRKTRKMEETLEILLENNGKMEISRTILASANNRRWK